MNVEAGQTDTIYSVISLDADNYDQVSYRLSGIDAQFFSLDEKSGALRFLSPPNAQVPQDINGDNRYELIITAQDLHGCASDILPLQIRVLAPVQAAPITVLFPLQGANFAGNTQVTTVTVKLRSDLAAADMVSVAGINLVRLPGQALVWSGPVSLASGKNVLKIAAFKRNQKLAEDILTVDNQVQNVQLINMVADDLSDVMYYLDNNHHIFKLNLLDKTQTLISDAPLLLPSISNNFQFHLDPNKFTLELDRANNRLVINGMEQVDLLSGIHTINIAPAALLNIAAAAVNPVTGHTYVLDAANKTILEYAADGKFVAVVSANSQATTPRGQGVNIPLFSSTSRLAFDSENNRLLLQSDSQLMWINVATGNRQALPNIIGGLDPFYNAYSWVLDSKGQRLVASNSFGFAGEHSLQTLDLTSGTQIRFATPGQYNGVNERVAIWRGKFLEATQNNAVNSIDPQTRVIKLLAYLLNDLSEDVPGPGAISYDEKNQTLWVTDALTKNSVAVKVDTGNKTPFNLTTAAPIATAWDSDTEELFVLAGKGGLQYSLLAGTRPTAQNLPGDAKPILFTLAEIANFTLLTSAYSPRQLLIDGPRNQALIAVDSAKAQVINLFTGESREFEPSSWRSLFHSGNFRRQDQYAWTLDNLYGLVTFDLTREESYMPVAVRYVDNQYSASDLDIAHGLAYFGADRIMTAQLATGETRVLSYSEGGNFYGRGTGPGFYQLNQILVDADNFRVFALDKINRKLLVISTLTGDRALLSH